LTDTDWRELSAILTELSGIMPDEEFVYGGIVLSEDPAKNRVHVDLRPFLQEIRNRAKTHESVG
jgi:hypothetical protein